ncbi:MAG: hypothetical protein R3D33_00540 [Hyphomicrobiaceae bacterium]
MKKTTILSGVGALMLVVAASGTASAASPSFSCHGRLNATERTICDSWRLAKLDRKLAYWYGKARERAGYFHQTSWLRNSQRDWLAERNSCGYDESCIRWAYESRIEWLRNYYEHV